MSVNTPIAATLSQEIINNANKTVNVKDDLGREIVLRKPKYSHYLNLLKALGNLANNEAYVKHVTIFSAVVSIDGQPQPLNSAIDLDHLVKVLEKSDNALELIIEAVALNFTDTMNAGEFQDQLKK